MNDPSRGESGPEPIVSRRWARLRFWTRLSLLLLIPPIVYLFAHPSDFEREGLARLLLPAVVGGGLTAIALMRFSCPACGRSFFSMRHANALFWPRRCRHCGIRLVAATRDRAPKGP